jgi:hypothetical protein
MIPSDHQSKLVEALYDDARKRRVVIFRRPSGTFGYREEYHYQNEVAEGWASLGGRACYWDGLETAMREVVDNVSWLPKR